jgi:hypothetical protein
MTEQIVFFVCPLFRRNSDIVKVIANGWFDRPLVRSRVGVRLAATADRN